MVTLGECLNDPAEYWYREPSIISPGTAPEGACVVSRGAFCGTMDHFHDKTSCLKSAGTCTAQADDCGSVEGSTTEGCARFRAVCDLEIVFCNVCETAENDVACRIENFEFLAR